MFVRSLIYIIPPISCASIAHAVEHIFKCHFKTDTIYINFVNMDLAQSSITSTDRVSSSILVRRYQSVMVISIICCLKDPRATFAIIAHNKHLISNHFR